MSRIFDDDERITKDFKSIIVLQDAYNDNLTEELQRLQRGNRYIEIAMAVLLISGFIVLVCRMVDALKAWQ